ncbi:MAG: TonB-dependent receptor plug domain-containing protein, partial [Thermoanaerobaculia bacterium]|nr:TonB-dependent receptor plug domain-containing protein [Thermoanaerobaculia bacterium]
MRSISLILILAAIPAHAQSWSPEVFRDSVVVTASALPEEVDSTPASVSVVTREQIERRNALDLEEVLRELPGMFLARAGSAGRQTSLFTRGVNSAQTLVLWNGIEINNPYFSGYDWGQFSTAGVEKIEVVRGPFSSLYGADAVGGVINVVTGANEPGVSADLQVGEHELLNGRIETTGVWSELRADVAVESREDEGFHPNDDFSQTALLGSLSWEMNERISVGFSGRFNDYELGIPFDQGEPSLQRRQEGSELQLAIPLTLELGETTWDVSLSRTEHEIDFADPLASFGPIETMTDSEINRASLSVRFPTPIGTVIAGGELEDATVDD